MRFSTWARLPFAIAFLSQLVSCSSSAPPPAPTQSHAYLSVTIAQEGGSVRIDSEAVFTSAALLVPPLAGDHVAVARAGGSLVSAVPFLFPTTKIEGTDPQGRRVSTMSPGGLSLAVVQLPFRSDIDEIEVLDATGAQVLVDHLNASGLSAQTFTPAANAPAPGEANVMPRAPQIVFFNASGGTTYLNGIEPGAVAVGYETLTPAQKSALTGALNALPDRLLAAVTHVGIARFPAALGLTGVTLGHGSVIFIDETEFDRGDDLLATAVHESAHAYTFLLQAPATFSSKYQAWPMDVRNLVAATITKYELESGFQDLWSTTHESGVVAGAAGAYDPNWMGKTEAQAQQAGFATGYGSSSSAEDIATYVERLLVPSNGGGELAFCPELRSATPLRSPNNPFPLALAIPFVKIQLLKGAAFFAPEVADSCTGDTVVEGPPGIFFDGAGLTAGLKGGWVTQDGADFLVVLSQGNPSIDASVRVLAPGRKPPLGLHRLDSFFYINQANNAVYVSGKNAFDARVSNGGLVLVSRVDSTSVRGAIFFLSLRDAAFLTTDRFALTTFRYDSP